MIQMKQQGVTVFESALYETTSTVIETADGIFVVDPNWLPQEIEEIRNYVDNIILEKQLYIIYTHSDFDHVIGAGAFEDAIVIASSTFKNHSDKEKIMQEIKDFDNKYYIERSYTPSYPVVHMEIKENGQQLRLKNTILTFYLAPGHTADGLFTVIEPEGIFLSGDYLSDVEFPFINSSYTDYIETIHRAETIVEKHELKLLVPGHGHATEDVQEINERIAFSKWYLQQLRNESPQLLPLLKEKYTFFDSMIDSHIENKKYVIEDK